MQHVTPATRTENQLETKMGHEMEAGLRQGGFLGMFTNSIVPDSSLFIVEGASI